MRIIVFIVLMLEVVFAQNSPIIIKKSIAQIEYIKPKYLFSNISIESSSLLRNIGELKDEVRKSINTTLNDVIDVAKKNDICSGGSYSITPIINYEKNNRKTIGQYVNFMLNCKFDATNKESYNDILAQINSLVSINKFLVLPQPSVMYQITQDEINVKKELMFEEFLIDSKELTNKYSKALDKECFISSISSSDTYSMPRNQVSMMAKSSDMLDSTYTNIPLENETQVRMDIILELQCK